MDTKLITAADALAAWDAGKEVPAFEVECEFDRQITVYAAAFDILRDERGLDSFDTAHPQDHHESFSGLTDREAAVAHSIAYVATKIGWQRMVNEHIHPKSPASLIRKPKSAKG
jgi:hypothetical protein